jgi:hypothetical protein
MNISAPAAVLTLAGAIVVTSAVSAGAASYITGKQIKDGTVTSADIKNGTVGTTDVKDESLWSRDVRDGGLYGSDIADGSISRTDLDSRARLAGGLILTVGACPVGTTFYDSMPVTLPSHSFVSVRVCTIK